MGARIFGGKVTVTTTPTQLSVLLGLPTPVAGTTRNWFSVLTARADPTNTETIWVGRSNVTAATNQHGFIRASESLSISLDSQLGGLDDLYAVVGSGTAILYVVGVI